MKTFSIGFRLLSLLAATSFLHPSLAQEPKGLQATLWVQRSPEYRAICKQAFTLARIQLKKSLEIPSWTAALEQTNIPKEAKPAIICDLDETLLDNSAYQARLHWKGGSYTPQSWAAWVQEEKAGAVPGALAFCKEVAKRGVRIFYISNRRQALLEATKNNMKALGFPFTEDASSFLLRTDRSDKSKRRRLVAQSHRVLLLLGDSEGDFLSPKDRESPGHDLEKNWGKFWIVLPNPMYGSWNPRRKRLKALRTEGPQKTFSLQAGPMNAWAAMGEACVWVQTKEPARIQLAFWKKDSPKAAPRLSPLLSTTKEGDCIARFVLTELSSGTAYDYRVLLEGIPIGEGGFHTQKQWRYRGKAPDLDFLLGSCLYINEKKTDRPGKPYGGGYEIFTAMAELKPDFMLWLGDNCYLREPDWLTPQGIRRRYRRSRAFGPLQGFWRATQHYAIWDDHDYGPNDSDRSFRLKDDSLRIFKEYWPQPRYGIRQAPGCFYNFTWSDCEFFMLDDRSYRSPNRSQNNDNKVMLGLRQMQWLKDSLISSKARFKFIVNGGQMTNPLVFFEGFGKFPSEQKQLFDFIKNNKLKGIIFLSGDRHASELLAYQHGEGASIWPEFTSSPLGAGYGGYSKESQNPIRVPGTWITKERSFGRVQVLGKGKNRRVLFGSYRSDGSLIWEHSWRPGSFKIK
jgi:alkaline phosphatase D